MGNEPYRWWIGTIPYTVEYDINNRFDNASVRYAVGQREIGGSTGYEHWQVCVNFTKPQRLAAVKKIFGSGSHWEPTKSAAALTYCLKVETAVPGSQFEYGRKPIDRSNPKDWDKIVSDARGGRLDEIPSDVLVRCYSNLRKIAADSLQPVAVTRRCVVYWGATGCGKSYRAWTEAGMDAYPKDPRTKFWDGYQNQKHVVMDEFRGGIDISHMLRWLDRYPVVVEIKGSATVLKAEVIWITSNLNPRKWYPDIDEETLKALIRRLEITEFVEIKSG